MNSENLHTPRHQPILVKSIMNSDVVLISPFATLREAIILMRDNGVDTLVVDKKNPHDAYGIITRTTLLRTIVAEDGDIDLLNVYDVATKPAIAVSRELAIGPVAQLMIQQGIRRVIVTQANQLLGMITVDHIVDSIMNLPE